MQREPLHPGSNELISAQEATLADHSGLTCPGHVVRIMKDLPREVNWANSIEVLRVRQTLDIIECCRQASSLPELADLFILPLSVSSFFSKQAGGNL